MYSGVTMPGGSFQKAPATSRKTSSDSASVGVVAQSLEFHGIEIVLRCFHFGEKPRVLCIVALAFPLGPIYLRALAHANSTLIP
jgi:hypothetical protein